jgi:cytochrome P450
MAVSRLPYTHAVLAETMRLYLPAWIVGRRALTEHRVRSSPTSRSARERASASAMQFAWMEGMLALATFAQRWRLRLARGHRVVPQPIVTLRARYGMRMIANERMSG